MVTAGYHELFGIIYQNLSLPDLKIEKDIAHYQGIKFYTCLSLVTREKTFSDAVPKNYFNHQPKLAGEDFSNGLNSADLQNTLWVPYFT